MKEIGTLLRKMIRLLKFIFWDLQKFFIAKSENNIVICQLHINLHDFEFLNL